MIFFLIKYKNSIIKKFFLLLLSFLLNFLLKTIYKCLKIDWIIIKKGFKLCLKRKN